jgi:hypothetical protein
LIADLGGAPAPAANFDGYQYVISAGARLWLATVERKFEGEAPITHCHCVQDALRRSVGRNLPDVLAPVAAGVR